VRALIAAALCGVLGGLSAAAAAPAPAADSLRAECDYGVTLALQGNLAAAESVFISLLSHAPGDTRALTNLGNLHLLRGEREAALALYGIAARMDSADAGILLDRATARYLMGEDSLARAEAADAVARAGGIKLAESLLGLKHRDAHHETTKAADMSATLQFPLRHSGPGQRTGFTRAELHGLLAASGVPASPPAASQRPGPFPSAPNASYESNAAAVLYWKR